MVYRYQPLYEDPEYYGDDLEEECYEPDEDDGWQSVETSVPEDDRPLYIGLQSTEEIQKRR